MLSPDDGQDHLGDDRERSGAIEHGGLDQRLRNARQTRTPGPIGDQRRVMQPPMTKITPPKPSIGLGVPSAPRRDAERVQDRRGRPRQCLGRRRRRPAAPPSGKARRKKASARLVASCHGSQHERGRCRRWRPQETMEGRRDGQAVQRRPVGDRGARQQLDRPGGIGSEDARCDCDQLDDGQQAENQDGDKNEGGDWKPPSLVEPYARLAGDADTGPPVTGLRNGRIALYYLRVIGQSSSHSRVSVSG